MCSCNANKVFNEPDCAWKIGRVAVTRLKNAPEFAKKGLNSPQHFYSNAALDNCEWTIWTCKVMLHFDALLSGKAFNIFSQGL